MANTKRKRRQGQNFQKMPPAGLTDQQKKAVQMLFYGERVTETAAALGVHRSTIWRWSNTRAFKKEWQRLNHNFRRRIKRHIEKLDAEREALLLQAEKRLQKEAENITGRPTKAFDNAWNAYTNALFNGLSLSQFIEWGLYNKPIRIKRRRAHTPTQHKGGKQGGRGV